MADIQTTVALNIGSQRIGMAVFEVSKSGGLVLKAYDSESIVADPSMHSVAINDLLADAIDQFEFTQLLQFQMYNPFFLCGNTLFLFKKYSLSSKLT